MEFEPKNKKKITAFLEELGKSHRNEMLENAEKASLFIDSYFIENDTLYVFKKTGRKGGDLHMSQKELQENNLLQDILRWTKAYIKSADSLEHIVTFDGDDQ